MIDIEKVVENLIDITSEKKDLLKRLFSLTSFQTGAIENEDMKELTVLIDKKQGEIDTIRHLDFEFETIVNDLKTVYGVKELDELKVHCEKILELKKCISEVMELLKEINSLEVTNSEKINAARDRLEAKINQADSGKKAMKQYSGQSEQTPAVFFDRKIK